jgi:hypothetical protein
MDLTLPQIMCLELSFCQREKYVYADVILRIIFHRAKIVHFLKGQRAFISFRRHV